MRKYNFFKLITIELCRFHYILTTTIEALALALALAIFLSKDGKEEYNFYAVNI